MAYATGTATNAADLFNKLIAFLTADATLVAAGENWTLLRRDTFSADPKRDLVELRGPGSGADSIYVQPSLYVDAAAPAYAIRVLGSQSWNNGVSILTPEGQPGSIQAGSGSLGILPRMPISDSAIAYWFVANGRRFVAVAKSGSYWGSLYAGFILPYGLPIQYPYPLLIGANSSYGDNYQSADARIARCAFWRGDGATSSDVYSVGLLAPGGAWIGTNRYYGGNNGRTWPWALSILAEQGAQGGGLFSLGLLTTGPDGKSPLLPGIIYNCTAGQAFETYGELDGVAAVPGFNIVAGDSLTVGADTWLAVQQATSTDAGRFAAIKLA